MNELFLIGTNDYTDAVDRGTYNVNRSDVFKEWTDANGTVHRDVTRTRISGSLRLGFHRAAALQEFLADIASAKTTGGFYPVTLYVNNADQALSFDAFMDLTATVQRDLANDRFFAEYALEVSQC